MLLSEAWGHYKRDKEYLGYSPVTLESYELYHRLFVEAIGDKKIEDVTYFEMKKFVQDLSKRLQPSSVIARMRHLKSLFRWANDEGVITKNEAVKLREPKLPQATPKPLTLFEIETIRDACKTPLEKSIFEFMYATGCRIGEIVKVNKSDVDWNLRSVQVNGKGNKDREVYFDLRCEIWIQKYLETRNDELEALFVTERKYKENGNQPRRMSIAQMRYILKRVAKRAGIKKSIYPHNLRHSFAMNMLENGAPMEAIQDFLGHTDPRYTEVYATLTTEMKREIYKKYRK